MSEKTREICTVVSQESIGAGIYSMWTVSYTHLTLPTILRV